ncbi:MAG: calcium-binding protein [Gaiellales bacterium]
MTRRHRLAILATALLALPVLTAGAQGATCHGLKVTTSKHGGTIIGTSGRDVILLTKPGVVHAGGGSDIICGSSGDDVIDAGAGDDVILGGAGRDTIRAGAGRDNVFGEAGGDRIDGGPGHDFLMGGAGVDSMARQGGDTISVGNYGVSVVLPMSAVVQFASTGMDVGLARSAFGSGVVPVAATANVLPTIAFGLGGYGAYIARGPAEPFSSLSLAASVGSALGSSLSLAGDFLLLPSSAPSTPNAISITNNLSIPVTAGLMQQVASSESSPAWTPIIAGQMMLEPNVQAVFAPTGLVSIFSVPSWQAGTLLAQAPTGMASAQVSPRRPTAAFTWNAQQGIFSSFAG